MSYVILDMFIIFFFKQKTAYEMRISDWSSDVCSSDLLFDAILRRSTADLDMLLTWTEYGFYPYAGVPWYSTIFGRDCIITALQLVWNAPEIATCVLKALALTQATEIDDADDAQPCKIVHELRRAAMARPGELPFCPLYATL